MQLVSCMRAFIQYSLPVNTFGLSIEIGQFAQLDFGRDSLDEESDLDSLSVCFAGLFCEPQVAQKSGRDVFT